LKTATAPSIALPPTILICASAIQLVGTSVSGTNLPMRNVRFLGVIQTLSRQRRMTRSGPTASTGWIQISQRSSAPAVPLGLLSLVCKHDFRAGAAPQGDRSRFILTSSKTSDHGQPQRPGRLGHDFGGRLLLGSRDHEAPSTRKETVTHA
jgi:hypothetical protein